jgi:hypothetical protein
VLLYIFDKFFNEVVGMNLSVLHIRLSPAMDLPEAAPGCEEHSHHHQDEHHDRYGSLNASR